MNAAEQIVENILQGNYSQAMADAKGEIKTRVTSIKEGMGRDILEKNGLCKIKEEDDSDEDDSDEDDSKDKSEKDESDDESDKDEE